MVFAPIEPVRTGPADLAREVAAARLAAAIAAAHVQRLSRNLASLKAANPVRVLR